jgi:hypothetical protein
VKVTVTHLRPREEIEKQVASRGNKEIDLEITIELLLDIRELLQGMKFKQH